MSRKKKIGCSHYVILILLLMIIWEPVHFLENNILDFGIRPTFLSTNIVQGLIDNWQVFLEGMSLDFFKYRLIYFQTCHGLK